MGVKVTAQERARMLEAENAQLKRELAKAKADLDFLAIMTDVDIEDEEEEENDGQ